MPSQQDLDQGGTFRQTEKVYLGPSVGWVPKSDQCVVNITSGGTTIILRGMNVILISVPALVTIQLSSSKATLAGPQAIPNQSIIAPTIIADIAGNANNFNIQILPFAGEDIDGLSQIDIVSNYGAYILRPKIATGGWTLIQ